MHVSVHSAEPGKLTDLCFNRVVNFSLQFGTSPYPVQWCLSLLRDTGLCHDSGSCWKSVGTRWCLSSLLLLKVHWLFGQLKEKAWKSCLKHTGKLCLTFVKCYAGTCVAREQQRACPAPACEHLSLRSEEIKHWQPWDMICCEAISSLQENKWPIWAGTDQFEFQLSTDFTELLAKDTAAKNYSWK